MHHTGQRVVSATDKVCWWNIAQWCGMCRGGKNIYLSIYNVLWNNDLTCYFEGKSWWSMWTLEVNFGLKRHCYKLASNPSHRKLVNLSVLLFPYANRNNKSDFVWFSCSCSVAQLCLTLRDPIDGSPPGSPVPGILQARTLEWVAVSFSSAWK